MPLKGSAVGMGGAVVGAVDDGLEVVAVVDVVDVLEVVEVEVVVESELVDGS